MWGITKGASKPLKKKNNIFLCEIVGEFMLTQRKNIWLAYVHDIIAYLQIARASKRVAVPFWCQCPCFRQMYFASLTNSFPRCVWIRKKKTMTASATLPRRILVLCFVCLSFTIVLVNVNWSSMGKFYVQRFMLYAAHVLSPSCQIVLWKISYCYFSVAYLSDIQFETFSIPGARKLCQRGPGAFQLAHPSPCFIDKHVKPAGH